MGAERQRLTEEMIEEKLKVLRPREIRYIDPMRMAQWSLDTACAMVDDALSKQTLDRAIREGTLSAYKAGKEITVKPGEFLVWYERHRK
jgi:hypothetical protein